LACIREFLSVCAFLIISNQRVFFDKDIKFLKRRRKMKAIVFQGERQMEIVQQDQPAPKEGEVVIRVKSCGICGTDQHIYHGQPGSAEVPPPMILGHELSGEIVQVNEEVKNLFIGDRISVDPNIYCGQCDYCQSGRAHLCENLQAVGVTRHGGMAEYVSVPAANCYKIPDKMSFEEAALVEPLGCVLHGLRKLNIEPGRSVLIIGGGFIGQLFLQLVKSQSAFPITVSEPVESKHQTLRILGADAIVNPLNETEANAIKNSADIVIECVGRKDSMELAIKAAKKGGQVLLFGVSSPETEITVSPFEIFSKELQIFGSFINPYTHKEAIALISQGTVDAAALISHRFGIEEMSEVMREYANLNVSKGIITFEN
jgi:L-iditol 2-dehydrogenase